MNTSQQTDERPAERDHASIVPADRVSAAAAGQIFQTRRHDGAGLRRQRRLARRLPPPPRQLSEQRRSPRVAVACHVKFRHCPTPHAIGTVVDLSTSGLFIKTRRVLYPGTIVAGELRSPEGPDHPELGFVGEVVRRAGHRGFGVRFIFMYPGDHTRLQAVVDAARPSDQARPRLVANL